MKLKWCLYEQSGYEKQMALQCFYRNKKELLQKFNEGYATCTYAVLKLGDYFLKHDIDFVVVSGDYDGSGHWWIEIGNTIYDIGNNIKEEFVESGLMEPIITTDRSNYSVDEKMSYKQYLKLYPTIKDL